MARTIQVLDEAMSCGANGWAAQRLTGYGASVQRDYDGTLMISDMMSDEFYLKLARALDKYDRGTIQFAQVSGAIDEGVEAPRRDVDFGGKLAEASGRPLIFNAIAAVDDRPQVFRTMLSVVDEYNKKGVPLVGHAVTVRANFRFTFKEQWNLFDNVDAWREATLGTAEERMAKLGDPAPAPADEGRIRPVQAAQSSGRYRRFRLQKDLANGLEKQVCRPHRARHRAGGKQARHRCAARRVSSR